MKQLLFIVGLLLSISVFSQETYTANDEILELKTEVDGHIDLLWNTFDGQYRYFVKDESGNIQELTNTKTDGHFQEEYKTLLNELTGQSAEKVDLTLFSLREFIQQHNETADSTVHYQDDKAKISTRLGAFAGATNSPFIKNTEDAIAPLFGAELEMFGDNNPRHSGFLGVRHSLENDDFQHSETQFDMGYRYRVIYRETFNVYAQVKVATYEFSNTTFTYEDEDNPGTFITEEQSGSAFDAPFILGLGADIKVGNGYITLVYGEIVEVFGELQADFPVDFSVGYKFNL